MKKWLCDVSLLFFLISLMSSSSSFSASSNIIISHSNSSNTSKNSSAPNNLTNSNNINDTQEPTENSVLYSITKEDYVWKNGPASFPSGTQYVVLEGNPYSQGAYTIRVKFPPSYKLPAHFHTDVEEVTVISGMIHVAVGNKLEKGDGFDLSTGGFTVLYPNINHYVWTGKEGAIVQIHGVGPRFSMYVDKKEDPTWRQLNANTLVQAKPVHKTFALERTIKKVSFNEGKLQKKWNQQLLAKPSAKILYKKIAALPHQKTVNKTLYKKQLHYSKSQTKKEKSIIKSPFHAKIKKPTKNIMFPYNNFAEQKINIISPKKTFLLKSG